MLHDRNGETIMDSSKITDNWGMGNLGPSFIYRRSVWEKHPYDENLQQVEDLNFYLQCFASRFKFSFVDDILVDYYCQPNSLSGRGSTKHEELLVEVFEGFRKRIENASFLTKKAKDRCVCRLGNRFLKLWKDDFAEIQRLLTAIERDFYKEIGIPYIIIHNKEKTVGYWSSAGKKVFLKKSANKQSYKQLYNESDQPSEYRKFYYKLLEASIRTGLVYYDLVESNLVISNNECKLLDLESVCHFSELKKIDNFDSVLNNNPNSYRKFINKMINNEIVNLAKLKEAWKIPCGGGGGKPYYSIEILGERLDGERKWELRWDLFKDHIDYSDMKILELGCNVALMSTYLLKHRNAHKALGIELPNDILNTNGNPRMMEAAKLISEGFGVHVPITQINLNESNYEEIIGTKFDIVLCMSLLKWINDKERMLDYLAKFSRILYEGHDSDEEEIARFSKRGFKHKILGKTQIGASYQQEETRTIIYFHK